MSVKVLFLGRLGNNLFQYALGRIIAEELGFAMSCEPSPFSHPLLTPPKRFGPSTFLISSQDAFPNAPFELPGADHQTPEEAHICRFKAGGWDGQDIDLQAILADRSPRRIVLSGFFQRLEYYEPHRDRIARWFAMPPIDLPEVADDDVLLTIRGGDFDRLRWRLASDFYLRALERMEHIGRVFISGVGVNERLLGELAAYNPVFFDRPPLEQFRFIQKFRRVVISNSTFTWWAGYLGRGEELYVAQPPPDAKGYHFTSGGVDLIGEDPRFRPVEASFR